MSSIFDAVLFDFGGVFTPSPFDAVSSMAAGLGTSPEKLTEVVFGSYSEDSDHPWHRLERGELPLESARSEILRLGEDNGFEADVHKLFAAMGGGGLIREELVACVRALRRRGMRTGLLTNNIAEFREHWRAALPVGELFDDIVDSSEVGIRKPDRRIYRLACERLEVVPERTVFLDDHPGNVDAAQHAGLVALLVGADPAEALAELERTLDGGPL